MSKGWTSPALAEPTSDNPRINQYFKELHKRSLEHEKKEPSLPSLEGSGDNSKDAAMNAAWSDWYMQRPQNDSELAREYGIGGKPGAGGRAAG